MTEVPIQERIATWDTKVKAAICARFSTVFDNDNNAYINDIRCHVTVDELSKTTEYGLRRYQGTGVVRCAVHVGLGKAIFGKEGRNGVLDVQSIVSRMAAVIDRVASERYEEDLKQNRLVKYNQLLGREKVLASYDRDKLHIACDLGDVALCDRIIEAIAKVLERGVI